MTNAIYAINHVARYAKQTKYPSMSYQSQRRTKYAKHSFHLLPIYEHKSLSLRNEGDSNVKKIIFFVTYLTL